MAEQEKIDHTKIGEGWIAVMSGKYGGEPISGFGEGDELKFVGKIQPPPRKYVLRFPEDFENSELRGKIVVFSSEEIIDWKPPKQLTDPGTE